MEESRKPFVIFVEGCDTVPPKVPVNLTFGKGDALAICEALKETEYAAFDFSIEPWTTANVNRGAAWVCMIDDARQGVYGIIVAGICRMTEQLYVFMGGDRGGDENRSGAAVETENVDPPAAKPDEGEGKGGADLTPTNPKPEEDVAQTPRELVAIPPEIENDPLRKRIILYVGDSLRRNESKAKRTQEEIASALRTGCNGHFKEQCSSLRKAEVFAAGHGYPFTPKGQQIYEALKARKKDRKKSS